MFEVKSDLIDVDMLNTYGSCKKDRLSLSRVSPQSVIAGMSGGLHASWGMMVEHG